MKKVFWFWCFLFFSVAVTAQQQWKFHLAFEDATGAKDTIWLLYDTTAHGTLPTDTALGEIGVTFDYSTFNVWVYNADNDSTKTSALPYVYYPSHFAEVRAINYQYPIIVSWDTALFHVSYLPFSQGYFSIATINNNYFTDYNMLWYDTAFAPYFNWGSHDQFPMTFILSYEPDFIDEGSLKKTLLVQSPFCNDLKIHSKEKIQRIEIYSVEGNVVFTNVFAIAANNLSILTSNWPSEIYILRVLTINNNIYYEKIIKNP